MRKHIWKLITRNIPEGTILPRRLLIARAILFPLEEICWRMNEARGYQFESDTWDIGGVKYAGAALRILADAHGETYRITRVGDCVSLERVDVLTEDFPDLRR